MDEFLEHGFEDILNEDGSGSGSEDEEGIIYCGFQVLLLLQNNVIVYFTPIYSGGRVYFPLSYFASVVL